MPIRCAPPSSALKIENITPSSSVQFVNSNCLLPEDAVNNAQISFYTEFPSVHYESVNGEVIHEKSFCFDDSDKNVCVSETVALNEENSIYSCFPSSNDKCSSLSNTGSKEEVSSICPVSSQINGSLSYTCAGPSAGLNEQPHFIQGKSARTTGTVKSRRKRTKRNKENFQPKENVSSAPLPFLKRNEKYLCAPPCAPVKEKSFSLKNKAYRFILPKPPAQSNCKTSENFNGNFNSLCATTSIAVNGPTIQGSYVYILPPAFNVSGVETSFVSSPSTVYYYNCAPPSGAVNKNSLP